MHTSFFSDIIARKPALFRAMLAFNGRLGSVVPDCPEVWRVPGLNTAIVAAELLALGVTAAFLVGQRGRYHYL